MTSTWFRPAMAAALLGIGAFSCGGEFDRSVFETPSAQAPQPVSMGVAAGFVDGPRKTVYVVDADAAGAPRARSVKIGADPVVVQRRAVNNELLILTRGVRGGVDARPEAPALWRVPADPAVPATAIPLGGRFNSLAQSPDGRWVIAYFGNAQQADEVLFNPNELEVIDLAQAAPVAQPKPIRSLGSIPRAILFSPEPLQNLPDGPRSLMVVVSDNYLTLVDVEHLNRPETSIPLTLPNDTRTLLAQQVLFDPATPGLFVRVSNGSDIYGVALKPLAPAERGEQGNDFRPSMSLLAAGDRPDDMALFNAGQGQRLLALSAARREAYVIDPASSRSTAISLDHPASRILIFNDVSPGDATTKQRALLMGNENDSTVTFMDLERIEELRTRNLDTRVMTSGASQMLPLVGTALVIHGKSSTSGVSVVSLGKRTISPITTTGKLDLGKVGAGRLWVTANGGDRVGYLDMKTLATGDVRLDANVAAVVPLDTVAMADRVLVSHGTPEGWVTLIDAHAPDRLTARSLRGFFASGLLDRVRAEKGKK